MLHFIVGTAGTGKTTRLIEELHASVRNGRKAVLLIPEQFSFEAEKLVYNALGPTLSLEAEVLSFTRLCNSIFRRFGGLAGVEVTSTARYLLMSIVLEELADKLVVYKKSAVSVSFLDTMLSACGEFKAAGVTPERLGEFAAESEDQGLGDKLRELSMIYGSYQALLDRVYTDPEDCLIRACALLERENFFDGMDVFVDGFTAFMAGEHALLRHIMGQAEHIWFAMSADSPYDEEQGIGLFSPGKSAMERLRRDANSVGTASATPEQLTEAYRYQSGDLAHLSRCYFTQEPWHGENVSISLQAASDPYDEAERVAAEIAGLVRSGYRYREIAVVARSLDTYRNAIELSFQRYTIPLFASQPEDIENKVLTGGVLAALDAVRGNYDSQAILLLAKSPVMGLNRAAVAELENYCYIWGIRGANWLHDFVGNPRGMAGGLEESDMLRLAGINGTRKAVAEPLARLRTAVRSGAGRVFARGTYQFLQEVHAAENLTTYAETLLHDKDAFLDENAQLWDILMGILDIFGTVLGNIGLPWRRLCELFRLAASSAELSTPPQTLDQVIAGNADRIRPGPVRAVFVLGANEGVFPPVISSGGVFTDVERGRMIKAGLELSRPSLQQVMLERYFTYYALTLPSERLVVSWRRSDLQGREQLPSMIVAQLRQLFPGLTVQTGKSEDLSGITSPITAFSRLALLYGEDTVERATLEAFYLAHSRDRDVSRLDTCANKPVHALREPRSAARLFGKSLRLSPSKVERFYLCPFSFFADHGLKLRKRKKVGFTPVESGSVLHHVLHVMVQKYGGKGLSDLETKALEEEVSGIIDAYLAERIEDLSALPTRFQYLYKRLKGTLARLLRRLGKEFAQSLFEPAAYEMPIRLGEEVEPLRLETADNIPVLVEGIVDRVDIMKAKNGNTYVRVVDYKSGRKDFKLQDILEGLNLQMLLYLFTIQENGAGRFGEVIPAGVLYMPIREQFVSADRDTDEAEITAERIKSWRMSGLLLEDEDALRGMEAEISGLFIPAKLKKDGTLDSKSALASITQLGKLSDKVKEQIVAMGEALSDGKIGAHPVDSADYSACVYCDYKVVCGFEEGDPVREIAMLDREKVLALLEAEESN